MRDVYRAGKYADLLYVRSPKFNRYYIVIRRAGVWNCTARDNANYSAQAYLRRACIIRHMHTDNERPDEEARIEAMSQHRQDWRATERDYPELLPW